MCDDIHEYFNRLIEILKPSFHHDNEAYFDESGTHDGSPVVCVAGYVLSSEQTVNLNREWGEALKDFGITFFHAVDCAQGVNEFAEIPQAKRTELVKRLIGIIKRRVSVGIAVSLAEGNRGKIDPPTWIKGGPSIICAVQAIGGVAAWADHHEDSGKISYFF